MRTVFEQSNATTLVDKMLGTAYDTVKEVADKLDVLEYINHNMASIAELATFSKENKIVITTLPIRGGSRLIPFTADYTADNVFDIKVKCYVNGVYYLSNNTDYITTQLTGSGVAIGLSNNAPLILENAEVSVLLLLVG